MDIKREIVEAIQIMIDGAISKVCPQITFGIVTEVVNGRNKCKIKIKNKEHEIAYYGKSPKINQKYPVFMPSNTLSLAFIITGD